MKFDKLRECNEHQDKGNESSWLRRVKRILRLVLSSKNFVLSFT